MSWQRTWVTGAVSVLAWSSTAEARTPPPDLEFWELEGAADSEAPATIAVETVSPDEVDVVEEEATECTYEPSERREDPRGSEYGDWGSVLLWPIEIGHLWTPKRIGGTPFQLGTIASGIGWKSKRIGYMALVRAGVGPGTAVGWGGFKGSLDAWSLEHFAVGASAAITAGGGKHRGENAGLLLSAEPGAYVRFKSETVGTWDVTASWVAPMYPGRAGWRGGALFAVAWHPAWYAW